MCYAFCFADAAAAGPIEADRMHLVQVGHSAMVLRDITKFGDGRDITVH